MPSEAQPPEEARMPRADRSSAPSGMKECPICGELIRVKARKCRYCGEIIDRGLAAAKKREKHRDMMRRRRVYSPRGEVSSAKSALICGILGLFCVGVILGPIAILLGISALGELKRRPEASGGGMAIAGIVLGVVDIIGSIIIIATQL